MNRNFNKKTESFWTEEEYNYLLDNNYSWSNKSYEYDGMDTNNCLYKYENGFNFEISVSSKGINTYKSHITHIGKLVQREYNIGFKEALTALKPTLKNKLLLNLYKFNSIPVILFILIINLLFLPFLEIDNKKEKFNKVIKDFFHFDYFVLDTVFPFTWGFNTFILGVSLTLFIM